MILPETFLRYADWLFARALKLRETGGDLEIAEKMEQRAVDYLDQAGWRRQDTEK